MNPENNIEYLSAPSEVAMADEWYDMTDKDHFWMIWRFNVAKRYLAGFSNAESLKILEIGCGNGINMQMFELDLGVIVDGCDLNETALKKMPDISGTRYYCNILENHPELSGKYDMVILFDILEHIQEDKDFLNNSLKYLKSNGVVMINVPAHDYLFSHYDIVMGHKRRYDKNNLLKLIHDCNINVELHQYWGFFMVPVLLIRKILMLLVKRNRVSIGFKPLHPIINRLFLMVMKLEFWLFNKPPTGTSLFVVGRKMINLPDPD